MDPAQWRPLLAGELDVRALGEQERLEPLTANWPYSWFGATVAQRLAGSFAASGASIAACMEVEECRR